MTNFKKRGQNLIDEISENLKKTIKKYNEIDSEDLNVSVGEEREIDLQLNHLKNKGNDFKEKEIEKKQEKENNSPILTVRKKIKKFLDDLDAMSEAVTKDFMNLEYMIEGIEKECENLIK